MLAVKVLDAEVDGVDNKELAKEDCVAGEVMRPLTLLFSKLLI